MAELLSEWLHKVWQSLDDFEEERISRNILLDAPVALFAAVDVLRGERLNDSLIECFTADGIRKAEDKSEPKLQDSSSKISYKSFFNIHQSSVRVFALQAFHDDRFRSCLLIPVADPYLLAMLYPGLTYLTSKAYDPGKKLIIPSQSLSAFIQLIQANSTSAAFSALIMYSIRHRTLRDYPDSFDHLFQRLDDSEKHSHGIGKLTIPSLSQFQLIKSCRRPVLIEPTHRNEIPHPFHLEPTGRRVG